MNLPADFITRTQPLLKEEWDSFLTALDGDIPVSIRINRNKSANLPATKIPWCDTGYYLDKRPRFTFDPLFHAGCYYVQDASSMFVERAIRQYVKGNVRVLDLCAAPGGKSTLIAGLLGKDSLLVSNEVIRSRANILAANLTKWGDPGVVITNNDPVNLGKLTGFFDIVLVDAPCSGEGMFRKDEGAISEWSVHNVKLCKERQRRILADVWPALKPGGVLMYSTCTYNTEENEENVQWIRNELGAEMLPVDTNAEWMTSPSFVEDTVAYRFFPHKIKGEGFFLSVLRKNGSEADFTAPKKARDSKNKKNKADLPPAYKDYISGKEDFTFYSKGEFRFAFPARLHDDLLLLKSHLNIVSEGICLGEFKGKDFVPNQSLALSNNLNRNVFETCEADWKTAVAYLRKESLVLPGQPKGYVLLTYKNMPLGFVKNIGARANNLYPQEWRIRSENIPGEAVNVIG
ncbi:MAG: RsmB/NOP family class I SAM-dependent RNA methyltransferase [Prevotella sp.]|nr:RsmB/NOP family class I SAM-dependent RNA methyltransferase [Prevotella sp.]